MIRKLVFPVALLVYHILFWHETLGVNIALFSLAAVLFLRGTKPFSGIELLYAVPLIVADFGLLLFHTQFSIVGVILITIAYLGFLTKRESSVLENFSSSALSYMMIQEGVSETLFAKLEAA